MDTLTSVEAIYTAEPAKKRGSVRTFKVLIPGVVPGPGLFLRVKRLKSGVVSAWGYGVGLTFRSIGKGPHNCPPPVAFALALNAMADAVLPSEHRPESQTATLDDAFQKWMRTKDQHYPERRAMMSPTFRQWAVMWETYIAEHARRLPFRLLDDRTATELFTAAYGDAAAAMAKRNATAAKPRSVAPTPFYRCLTLLHTVARKARALYGLRDVELSDDLTIESMLGDRLAPSKKRQVTADETRFRHLFAALDDVGNVQARAVQWLMLTGARKMEGCGAMWSEIDETANTWTIPPERLKCGEDAHVVYLTAAHWQILKQSPTYAARTGYLWPADKFGNRMMPDAPNNLIRKLKPTGTNGEALTVHDLRRSFSTLIVSRANIDSTIADEMIGHFSNQGTRTTYQVQKEIREALHRPAWEQFGAWWQGVNYSAAEHRH